MSNIKYLILLLIIFLISVEKSFSDDRPYLGPQSPGVEDFECGIYKIKGKFVKKENSGAHKLYVYYRTTRQYSVEITGKKVENVIDQINGRFISLEGEIRKSGKADSSTLHVLKRYPDYLFEQQIYENTITQIKKHKCEI